MNNWLDSTEIRYVNVFGTAEEALQVLIRVWKDEAERLERELVTKREYVRQAEERALRQNLSTAEEVGLRHAKERAQRLESQLATKREHIRQAEEKLRVLGASDGGGK